MLPVRVGDRQRQAGRMSRDEPAPGNAPARPTHPSSSAARPADNRVAFSFFHLQNKKHIFLLSK